MGAGPGCSSIAYGASEEIGPFRINKTGSSLYLNKYSWNRGKNENSQPSPINPAGLNGGPGEFYLGGKI